MPTSQAGIYNMALAHLALADTVDSPADDYSEPAAVMNVFWEDAVGASWEAKNWTFASRRTLLSLLTSPPNADWDYVYALPANCGRIVRLLSPGVADTAQPVPYEQRWNGTQRVIWTDLQSAEIEFVDSSYPINLWPSSFSLAVSLLLASLAAPRLRGSSAVAVSLYQRWQLTVAGSIATQQSQQVQREDIDPEAIRARA